MNNFDSSKYKKELWEKEYTKEKGLKSSKTSNPSSSLRNFLQSSSLKNKNYAVDIGSGNGRNSIYLSLNGFSNILGIELSTNACIQAKEKIRELGIENITILNQSISKGIPVKDNSINLVIDMMTMHATNKKERDIEFSEIKRILENGGFFLFFTMLTNSKEAKKLIKEWKGEEEGSYRFEMNGMVFSEKTFTKKELEKLLFPLKLIQWEEFDFDTEAFGKIYRRRYCTGVFRK